MTIIPNRFSGRTAIITGGASGLGLQTAKRIVSEGGRVALWDQDAKSLELARNVVAADLICKLDVSEHSEVVAAAANTFRSLGRIDILLNSAGIVGATAPVIEFPIESWSRVIAVNLTATFYCCREIAPFMLKSGYGRIVNIASIAGKEGNPFASAYSASKSGVIALTKSLGKELATKGIMVNCITPATFDSAILQQLPQAQIDYMKSKIPMGRLGTVSENAALACWLASEECSFSTAATFDISGGRATY